MVTIVVLGQTLQHLVEEPEFQFEISEATTVRALFQAHSDKVSELLTLLNKGEVLVTVNRKVGALDSPVRDGDTIKLTHNVNPTYDGAMWHNP
jgi:sulfur-carrier protein